MIALVVAVQLMVSPVPPVKDSKQIIKQMKQETKQFIKKVKKK